MTNDTDLRAKQIEAILEGLRDGKSLRKICAAEDMPSKSAFLDWVEADKDLADQYARARERGWDALAEQALDETERATDVQAARLVFDARRWYLGKLAPKKYGEKVTQEVTGPNGGPIQSQTSVDLSNASEEQLRVIASLPTVRK